MPRFILWLLAGSITIALTTLAFFPATWLGVIVEKQSAGRLTLGDAQGSMWRGSAFIGGAASGNEPVTALLPGRFSWRISPIIIFGQVDIELQNSSALSQAIHVTGSWSQWQVSPAEILIGAERLSSLGAPLNTIQPSGQMRLSWQPLQLARQNGAIEMNGTVNLEMNDIASRLSPVKPLGSYNLAMDWNGQHAQLLLKTIKGAMVLNGSGTLSNGRLQFSGSAQAAIGQEEELANFLNLLGQRRQQDGHEVIALEFR
jgi:general secretion pathway protein N